MTNNIFVYKIFELQQGYYLESGYLHCHYCDTSFAVDEVYPQNGRYFTAEAMIDHHLLARSRRRSRAGRWAARFGDSDAGAISISTQYARHFDWPLIRRRKTAPIFTTGIDAPTQRVTVG